MDASEQDANYVSEGFDEMEDEGDGTQNTFDGTVEEEDDGAKDDQFSILESDNPEQANTYLEYLELIKAIECQNQMIDQLKEQIIELCQKRNKTSCDMDDIKKLRCQMDNENGKLKYLMERAVDFQNHGSRRRYGDIKLATTFEEYNMPPIPGTAAEPASWKNEDNESEPPTQSCEEPAEPPIDMHNLCCALDSLKVCSPQDKCLINDIIDALGCGAQTSKNDKSAKTPCVCKVPQAEPKQSPCSPCVPKPKPRKCKPTCVPQPCSPPASEGVGMPCVDSLDKLRQKIICMQFSVNKMKQEISKREKNKSKQKGKQKKQKQQKQQEQQEQQDVDVECENQESGEGQEEQDPISDGLAKRPTKNEEIQKLNDNYLYLLQEYAKKDYKLRAMEKRLKGFVAGACNSNNKQQQMQPKNPLTVMSSDEAELQLMKVRVGELKEEQVEFKCIMREQSSQLEEYRQKYLASQQRVEEQTVLLEKLNLNNKRVEKQINNEIKDIRNKFQEKLNELLHFPKMLENEQIKLVSCNRDKEELQGKLMLVCKELKTLKNQNDQPKQVTDCRPMLAQCQAEIVSIQKKMIEVERDSELYCEQATKLQDDLDVLRAESAKIIARTKERTEIVRQQQNVHINRLEKELALCRATACMSVKDREAVICEMQGQLNALSYSFDAAQKQIKTLRNHIAYMSNENCFPVKC